MKKIKFLFGTFALIFAITLIGCGGPETPPPEEPEEDPRVEETIPIPQESGKRDVYMFFSNKGDYLIESDEYWDTLQNSPSSRNIASEHFGISHDDLVNDYSHYKCGLGIEAVRNAYNLPLTKKSSASRTINSDGTYNGAVYKDAASVEDTSYFWVSIEDEDGESYAKKINATCRYVNDDCQIFVQTQSLENNTWKNYDYYDSTGTGLFSGTDISKVKITNDGLKELADKFSSIYKAEQALLGDANLDNVQYIDIIDTCEKITILISDLGYKTYIDEKSKETLGYSGILGYFYPMDLNCGCDNDGIITYGKYKYYTNQRMMFTLNTAGFYKDSSEKHLDLGGTDEMYSTLGHEFNHMLNYINKTLLSENPNNPVNYSSWFTEMLSAMAEDFIPDADYLNLTLDPANPYYPVQISRIPTFFTGTNEGMIDWDGTDSVYYSYGFAYAFGAYLIRNYGGVKLVHELATNKYADKQAVTEAMKACGFNETYDSVLAKFPRALINTTTDNSKYPTFNKAATGSITTTGGTTYNYTFPAVDLYNFTAGYEKDSDAVKQYYENPYWKEKIHADGKTYIYGPVFNNYGSYKLKLYGNSFFIRYLGKTTDWPDGVKLLYPRDENIVVEIFVQ